MLDIEQLAEVIYESELAQVNMVSSHYNYPDWSEFPRKDKYRAVAYDALRNIGCQILDILEQGLYNEGADHKQWALVELAKLLDCWAPEEDLHGGLHCD